MPLILDYDILNDIVSCLKVYSTELKGIEDDVRDLEIPTDGNIARDNFFPNRTEILLRIISVIESINEESSSIQNIIDVNLSAEQSNVAVANNLMDSIQGVNVALAGASVSSSYDFVDVEIPGEDVDVGLEENVTETEVEPVIDLIYGENPTLTDDERTRIVEAIVAINETKILEGLDEEPANIIKSEIIKDYLDGELDLTEISKEDLQEYIDSHPSIKIHFEMVEAVESFASLIESGVLTNEQIHTILEENIQICDSEESFQDAYMNVGGIQTDVSQIQSFYSAEENKIYIRNTVDSTVISNSIICVLGDIMFVDEENGDISYYPVSPELNTDKVIDISIKNNISSDSTFIDLDNIVNSSKTESDSNLNLSE